MGAWERREDAKNLTLIAVSGVLGALLTGALFIGRDMSAHRNFQNFRAMHSPRYAGTMYRFEPSAPPTSAGPIYGRVRTVDGREITGFIRWDRNEGSWTDILDAAKVTWHGRETVSGVRFGQIRAIQVQGPHYGLLTLRSGQHVEMAGVTSDLGEDVRGIVVTEPDGRRTELCWDEVDFVEFLRAPQGVRLPAARLYGTLTTRSGQTFTGRIGWNMDDISTSDFLGSGGPGSRQRVSFGAIRRIVRDGPDAARVVLRSGEQVTLRGTPDVGSANDGITVSDPALGQVKVDWRDFDNVTFSAPPRDARAVTFDGGRPITGTVLTDSGEALTGTVRWDHDEASTWEMLNGSAAGADFEVEFGQIARIRKAGRGATVTLKDGRSFELSGSNDVDGGNRGILVNTGSEVRRVSWSAFKELRLDD
ncbi:MAG: hypothetical protein LJF06_18340 [Gemmatimonadetes bacterium]|nr:hypothetical protein [Gemmatimonadota bacterium]